jgi:hypothetical protein
VLTTPIVKSPAVTVEPSASYLRFSLKPNQRDPIEIDELPNSGDAMDMFFFPPIRDNGT